MLGQPVSMLLPEVIGFKPDRQAQGRRHRHRPRAHRHPDAAQEGRGRQVRRVLRPRPRQHDAGRPRHDRQHGARNTARPAASSRSTPRRSAISPCPAATNSRIALVEAYSKAQGMWRDDDSRRSGLHRHARARPRRRRAVDGRPEAPGRPRPARRHRRRLRQARWRPNTRRPAELDKPLRRRRHRLRPRPWRRRRSPPSPPAPTPPTPRC